MTKLLGEARLDELTVKVTQYPANPPLCCVDFYINCPDGGYHNDVFKQFTLLKTDATKLARLLLRASHDPKRKPRHPWEW